MNRLNQTQLQALRVVKEDLLSIKAEWGHGELNDSVLRQRTSVLNLLLVDKGGLLTQASNWLNFSFGVRCPITPFNKIPKKRFSLFLPGGAKVDGIMRQCIWEVQSPTLEERRVLQSFGFQGAPQFNKLSLYEFINGDHIVLDGSGFSRLDIIYLIANKLGGKHFDLDENFSRKGKSLEKLVRIGEQYRLSTKTPIYHELLAIGQLLANSNSTDRLISKISSILPNL